MKFNFQLIAKLAIPVCLVLATTNAYYANNITKQNKTLAGHVSKAKTDLATLEADGREIEQKLAKDTKKIILEDTLSLVLLGAMKMKVEHGVSISVLTVEKKGGASSVPLTSLSEKIKGTNVKTVKLLIKGGYSSYGGLQAYLAELKSAYPLALVALRVENKSFEMALRLYGN